jgi:hypothetical protein
MNPGSLPHLPLQSWEESRLYWHLVCQIVGKVRMQLHPPLNHWWHVTLSLSPQGLTTGAIPHGDGSFEIEQDLLRHEVIVRTAGRSARVPLGPKPIAEFYREFVEALGGLGISVEITPKPFKMRSTIPFPEDFDHRRYDPEAVHRAWSALASIEPVFKEFRSGFQGKSSPVHFFWHSFDLAAARFSGKSAPEMPGVDPVTRKAYSHEVNSAGFWFGDDAMPMPAFYCYTAPSPPGLDDQPLRPSQAKWQESGGSPMALLMYDDVRESSDPRSMLLDFLQSSYEAGANAAGWDRRSLESSP